MDIFIEKIISRKKGLLDYAIIALVFLGVIFVSFLAMVFIPGFALLIIVGICYLGYFLVTMRNIEYEYAVTNGDLDIDKIINQRKRKRVFSGNAKEFEIVARVKSDKYTREYQECKNIKDYSSHKENSQVWFIGTRDENGLTVILFEPNEKMIDSFYTFNPRKVFKY